MKIDNFSKEEQQTMADIYSTLKNLYQKMVDRKNCHICQYHGYLNAFPMKINFCKKHHTNCPDSLSCNEFEVIK